MYSTFILFQINSYLCYLGFGVHLCPSLMPLFYCKILTIFNADICWYIRHLDYVLYRKTHKIYVYIFHYLCIRVSNTRSWSAIFGIKIINIIKLNISLLISTKHRIIIFIYATLVPVKFIIHTIKYCRRNVHISSLSSIRNILQAILGIKISAYKCFLSKPEITVSSCLNGINIFLIKL